MLTPKELCDRAGKAFGRRGNLMLFWQETAEQFYPERADFTVTKTLGESFASNLYASDPVIFRRDFGNWIGSTLRPKGREWFAYRARSDKINARQRVKIFLTDKAQTTRNLLYDQKSQFIPTMREGDHDWVTFGNAVASVEDRADKQGLLIKGWHLRDCAWEDDAEGVTHCMYRRFEMSAENIMLRGKSRGWKVPATITKLVTDKQGDTMVPCYHVTMPCDLYDLDKPKRRKGFNFVSVYLCNHDAEKACLAETPIPIFNYAVSRWFTVSGSPYGFSPSVCCSIPDARTIQTMTWSILEAGEKAVEPPLIAVREAILGGVELYSGGVTWIDGKYDEKTGEAIRALQMGKEPQLGIALREGVRNVMGDAWYLNKLFLPPPTAQPMTAEEVSSRNAEYLRVSQPIIEPAEPERNGKILDIATEMAQFLGYWGDPDEIPEELRGQDVDYAYDNPIEDARKLAKTQGFTQALQLAQATDVVDPSLKQNMDWNTGFREALTGIVPAKWILPEEEGGKQVQQGQQAQQAQQLGSQVERLVGGADVAAAAGEKQAKAQKAQAEAAAIAQQAA